MVRKSSQKEAKGKTATAKLTKRTKGNESENLQRLSRSSLLMSFVKKNNGSWNHETWLGLCERVKDKGYEPINYDKVGLCLEEKKAVYLSQNQ